MQIYLSTSRSNSFALKKYTLLWMNVIRSNRRLTSLRRIFISCFFKGLEKILSDEGRGDSVAISKELISREQELNREGEAEQEGTGVVRSGRGQQGKWRWKCQERINPRTGPWGWCWKWVQGQQRWEAGMSWQDWMELTDTEVVLFSVLSTGS